MIVVTIGVHRYALPKHCKTSVELFASAYAEYGKEVRCVSYKKPCVYEELLPHERIQKNVSVEYFVDVVTDPGPPSPNSDDGKSLQELCEKEGGA
jgi:hypothetical protein